MVDALRKLASRRVEGLDKLSDAEIVALCKKELPSDLTAYRELLRRYEGLVYNTCAKYIGSAQDAEEVAQDAYKIVQNYCRNRVAKLARKREGTEEYQKQVIDIETGYIEPPKKSLVAEKVEVSMNKMKEKEREILVMKFTTGLTIQEISEVMEIGLSAAKMRLYRALDSFKQIYAKETGS